MSTMDDKDYLQDPEKWEDKLPQPYKTINKILGNILEDAWVKIEEREVIKKREATRVKIPSGAAGVILGKNSLTNIGGGIQCGDNSVVVVGNGMCVCGVKYRWINDEPVEQSKHSATGSTDCATDGYEGNENLHTEIISELSMKHEIIRLEATQQEDVLIIFVQLEKGIKVLALFEEVLTELTDICYLHKEKQSRILNFSVSHTCTHLAVSYHCPPQPEESSPVTTAPVPRSAALSSKNSGKGTSAKTGPATAFVSTDDSVLIALYTLTVHDWISELHKSMELNEKGQELSFSKPLVLYYIPSPLPLVPCSAASPAAAFQNVCDEKNQTLPSGDLHCLTEQYFENRWKHFVSKRQDFIPIEKREVPVKSTDTNTKQYMPTCHYLYYKNGLKQEFPHEVAVWWQDHSHLIIYPVKEGGKLATLPPTRRIPQASDIICSASSIDSSLLVLGLNNGVVVVWNMKRIVCSRVVSCTKPPDQIIALDFFSDKHGNDHVGVGSKSGKLLDINLSPDLTDPSQSVTSFTARTSKQQQIYQDLFASNEYNLCGKLQCFIADPQYPTLLISLQDDGCVVIWNPSEGEALCKFELSSNGYMLKLPSQYALTKDGKRLLLLVQVANNEEEDKRPASHILCLDIFSMPQVAHYRIHDTDTTLKKDTIDTDKADEEALLRPAEIFLDKYIKSRYTDSNECITMWENSWTDLSSYLLQKT